VASEADLLRVAIQLGVTTADLRKSLNYAGLDICTAAERKVLEAMADANLSLSGGRWHFLTPADETSVCEAEREKRELSRRAAEKESNGG